jgi:tRNA threonylcarbamoyladenosine biosynthesis protein TsaE
MIEILAFTQAETEKTACDLAQKLLKNPDKTVLICLKGELGAGKTTFVRAFCKSLGIDECLVKSPTYTYLREYKGNGQAVYHFDFYRLNQADDLVVNEILEILDKEKSFMLIEWPEKIEHILPENRIDIIIKIGEDKNSRKITINNDS